MKSIFLYISGLIVELRCRHYGYIKYLCREYLLYGIPCHVDVELEVTDKELDDRDELPWGYSEPEANREFYKLHKKLRTTLLEHNSVIMHGTAICFDEYGIIFSASPGTGKSTQADLWRDVLGKRVSIINDDWPILRIIKENVYVCGSPWCGIRNINSRIEIPVRNILFLERASMPYVLNLSESDAITGLIKRTIMLHSELSRNQRLYDVIASVVNNVNLKRVGVNLESESVSSILSLIP